MPDVSNIVLKYESKIVLKGKKMKRIEIKWNANRCRYVCMCVCVCEKIKWGV